MTGFERAGAAGGSGSRPSATLKLQGGDWSLSDANLRMKPLVLTRHAEEKIAARKLKFAWVERTACEPQWIEPDHNDPTAERRFRAIPEFGGRFLRVVCVETDRTIRIITATFDRGARRKP